MLIYGLKNCDTCRKALKSIPNAEFRDVRADGVPRDLLARAHKQFGAALLNKMSATWRGLDEQDRARAPLELLADHPTLMKRPLIVSGGALYLGWDLDTRAALGFA